MRAAEDVLETPATLIVEKTGCQRKYSVWMNPPYSGHNAWRDLRPSGAGSVAGSKALVSRVTAALGAVSQAAHGEQSDVAENPGPRASQRHVRPVSRSSSRGPGSSKVPS